MRPRFALPQEQARTRHTCIRVTLHSRWSFRIKESVTNTRGRNEKYPLASTTTRSEPMLARPRTSPYRLRTCSDPWFDNLAQMTPGPHRLCKQIQSKRARAWISNLSTDRKITWKVPDDKAWNLHDATRPHISEWQLSSSEQRRGTMCQLGDDGTAICTVGFQSHLRRCHTIHTDRSTVAYLTPLSSTWQTKTRSPHFEF